jgi:hypothetical protein
MEKHKKMLNIYIIRHITDTMENTMNILQVERKEKMLDTLENFYIYIYITKQGLQMNKISTSGYNPIYEF